jgi:DnaK suppressor protein
LNKKEEIVAKLSEVYNESKEVESGIAQDIADKAESSYTKEFLLSLSNAERELLFLIDEALKRIDKNEYGICQMCQKTIGKKRLGVVPWAPHCIECQEKAEEES